MNEDFDANLSARAEEHGVTIERTSTPTRDYRGPHGTNEAFVTFRGSEEGMRDALSEVGTPYDAFA